MAKKLQPFLHITEPHLCSKYTKITLDHDIPGAIGVLIGIS